MRIRPSVTRIFAATVVPALCLAVSGYFGWYAVFGERGVLALDAVHAKLDLEQARLAQLNESETRLRHRIELLKPGSADPDLVEELARTQLMDGAPGQVAVPRPRH